MGLRSATAAGAGLVACDLPKTRCLVSRHFDAIIIKTGQASPSLSARFAAQGPTLPTGTELFP